MIYIFIILSILFYILFKFKKCKNEYFKLIFKYLFIAFLTSTVLELTIFNFRHYESLMFNNKKELYNYTYNGITCENDKCNVLETSDAYIEIRDINEDINNIYINFDINKNSKFSHYKHKLWKTLSHLFDILHLVLLLKLYLFQLIFPHHLLNFQLL